MKLRLKNSADILDALSRALGDCSDYRIAKELGTTTQNVSHARAGRRGLSRQQCKIAARILGCEPGALITIVAAEREEDRDLAASMLKVAARGMAAALLMGVCTIGSAPPAQAAGHNAESVYYVKSRRRRRTAGGAAPIACVFSGLQASSRSAAMLPAVPRRALGAPLPA